MERVAADLSLADSQSAAKNNPSARDWKLDVTNAGKSPRYSLT
jgi:hypothetical protein